MRGGVWSWDTDGWGSSNNWGSSYGWGSSNGWGSSVSSVSKTDGWGSDSSYSWSSGNSGVAESSWGSSPGWVSYESSFWFWYWSSHGAGSQHNEYGLHWIHCVDFLCTTALNNMQLKLRMTVPM